MALCTTLSRRPWTQSGHHERYGRCVAAWAAIIAAVGAPGSRAGRAARAFRWMQFLVRAALALQVLDWAHLRGPSCIRLHVLDPAIGPFIRYTNVCCGSYGCEISVAHFATGLGKPETRRRST